MIIAIPYELCGLNEGLNQLIATLLFPMEYDFIDSIWIEDVELPAQLMAVAGGPRLGSALIDRITGGKRPLLGMILKPRLGVAIDVMATHAFAALTGGADYIIDDELVADPPTDLNFEARVAAFADVAKRAEDATGVMKYYIPNIGASPYRALAHVDRAAELGCPAILLNGFVGGLGLVEMVRHRSGSEIGIVSSNMGLAVISRAGRQRADDHRVGGIAEPAFVKLTRIAGADAVFTGIVDASWYHKTDWEWPKTVCRTPIEGIQPAVPVIAGGLAVGNLWQNIKCVGASAMLAAGKGILGYPAGPYEGARIMRALIEALVDARDDEEAKRVLIHVAKKNKSLVDALDRGKQASAERGRGKS